MRVPGLLATGTVGVVMMGASAVFAGIPGDESSQPVLVEGGHEVGVAAVLADDPPPDTGYRITIPGLQSDKPSPDPPPLKPDSPVSAQGLTLWSNGDSTSYFMTVAFLGILGGEGAIPTTAPDYVVSSGLMSPAYYDWPAHLREAMAAYDPDVVAFMLGANDAVGQPDLEVYRARVAEVMDLLQRPGRIVLWVGEPTIDPAARPALAAYIPLLNNVFKEEAAKRDWVRYVDAYKVTSGPNGGFAQYLPDENGNLVLARADDGVHLSGAGGRLIAEEAIRVLFGG